MGAPKKEKQLGLELRSWGGKRKGAGRKPAGRQARAPHDSRFRVSRHHPAHVSVRMAPHVWNLRSRRCSAIIFDAVQALGGLEGFRVTQLSVQGDHLHLIVEAEDNAALSGALNVLLSRVARALNRVMGRRGNVLEDRFHARPLRTPTEVRAALGYVLGNAAHHALGLGRRGGVRVEPYACGGTLAPGQALRLAGLLPAGPAVTAVPRSWLLCVGFLGGARPRGQGSRAPGSPSAVAGRAASPGLPGPRSTPPSGPPATG